MLCALDQPLILETLFRNCRDEKSRHFHTIEGAKPLVPPGARSKKERLSLGFNHYLRINMFHCQEGETNKNETTSY